MGRCEVQWRLSCKSVQWLKPCCKLLSANASDGVKVVQFSDFGRICSKNEDPEKEGEWLKVVVISSQCDNPVDLVVMVVTLFIWGRKNNAT